MDGGARRPRHHRLEGQTVKVWRDGACERTIQAHMPKVRAVAVLPGGARFVSGSRTRRHREAVHLRRRARAHLRGGQQRGPPCRTASRRCPTACTLWSALAAGQQGRGPAVPRRRDARPHLQGAHRQSVRAVAVTPDGQHIISGSKVDEWLVKVWSVATKSLVSTCAGHTGSVAAVAAMPDGQRILSGATDKTVRVCRLDGTLENTFSELHTGYVTALVALPDNQHALSGGRHHRQALQRQRRRRPAHLHAPHTPVTSLALLPDGLRFVSGLRKRLARARPPHAPRGSRRAARPAPRLAIDGGDPLYDARLMQSTLEACPACRWRRRRPRRSATAAPDNRAAGDAPPSTCGSRRHRPEDDLEKPGVSFGDDPTDGTMLLLPEGGGGGGEEFMFERSLLAECVADVALRGRGRAAARAGAQAPPRRRAALRRPRLRQGARVRRALVDDDDGHALDATDEAVGGEGLALSLGQAMTGAAGSHDAFEWTSRRRSCPSSSPPPRTMTPPPRCASPSSRSAPTRPTLLGSETPAPRAAGSEGGTAAAAGDVRGASSSPPAGCSAAPRTPVAEDVNGQVASSHAALRGARAPRRRQRRNFGRRRAHRAHRAPNVRNSPPPRRASARWRRRRQHGRLCIVELADSDLIRVGSPEPGGNRGRPAPSCAATPR